MRPSLTATIRTALAIILCAPAGFADSITTAPQAPAAIAAGELEISGPLRFEDQDAREEIFDLLVAEEPTVDQVQRWFIQSNDLSPARYQRWQWLSRASALMPKLSFDHDISTARNINIDRGSTSDIDEFIVGPDEYDEDWGITLSWELSDLIWAFQQTSIDSRKDSALRLRAEMLREVTQIYYLRRKSQMQIFFMPPQSPEEHLERLLTLHETTALLNALTDGKFRARLLFLSRDYPEFESIATNHAAI